LQQLTRLAPAAMEDRGFAGAVTALAFSPLGWLCTPPRRPAPGHTPRARCSRCSRQPASRPAKAAGASPAPNSPAAGRALAECAAHRRGRPYRSYVGSGPGLLVYAVDSRAALGAANMFRGGRVHGIVLATPVASAAADVVAVFGQRRVRLGFGRIVALDHRSAALYHIRHRMW
jgi:hypothetical protein